MSADRTTAVFSGRRVAPSILSADFSRLGAQVGEVMQAGARVIHVDVMDGHFVPPITIGPLIVSAIADQVHGEGGALDVHLMIERPAEQVAEFAKAGADCITVHAEAADLGAEHPRLASRRDRRFLQILPQRDRTTGFFIARFRREEA